MLLFALSAHNKGPNGDQDDRNNDFNCKMDIAICENDHYRDKDHDRAPNFGLSADDSVLLPVFDPLTC